jgi:hypothetical protein
MHSIQPKMRSIQPKMRSIQPKIRRIKPNSVILSFIFLDIELM